MSRGPGRWQRAVLEAVAEAIDPETGFSQWVSVDEVYKRRQGQHLEVSVGGNLNSRQGQHLEPSTRESIRRAMRTLARSGQIDLADLSQERPTDDPHFWGSTVKRRVLAARVPASLLQEAAEARQRAIEARDRGLGRFDPELMASLIKKADELEAAVAVEEGEA